MPNRSRGDSADGRDANAGAFQTVRNGSLNGSFDASDMLAYKKGLPDELFSRNRLAQTIPALAQPCQNSRTRKILDERKIDWTRVKGWALCLSRLRTSCGSLAVI